MRLFEGKLPEKAGEALIVLDERADAPIRKNEVITIPSDPLAVEFFTLLGGQQFLLYDGDRLYFGGTDERPFLVELNDAAFTAFAKGGEEAFFNALKPPAIKQAEKLWGSGRTRRQGDIHAYALPFRDWWELFREFFSFSKGSKLNLTPNDASLFGTRHILKGEVVNFGWGDQTGNGSLLLAEGVVEAPDHGPLVLNGLHLLQQTSMLTRPKEAD